MNELLRVDDLQVVYHGRGRRQPKTALDGVSIEVERGQTLGLVGESGSGKSTLGNCVLGLVRTTRGTITFDGQDITHLSGRARRAYSTQIQAVFQDPYSTFNPHRTIEQSVGETLPRTAVSSAAERRQKIAAMLERVGLDESALGKYPAQFSGGQRQRMSIARALLPEPRLVVCDESVSALDLSVQAQVLNLLLELQREREVAYLFITHDLSVVRHMSTRIAVLEHGRLAEEGPAEQVTGQPSQAYTKRLVAASPIPNPRVQDARRRTRRALSQLPPPPPAASAPVDPAETELVRALESQAVVEALELGDTSLLAPEPPVSQSPVPCPREGAVDVEQHRAAVLELSPRTAMAALGAELAQRVLRVRAQERLALAPGRHDAVAETYAQVLVAVHADRGQRALSILSGLHADPSSRDITERKEQVTQR